MGTTDKVEYVLRCTSCDIQETVIVREYGSAWSTYWPDKTSVVHFDVSWTGGDRVPPKITSATCVKCGSATLL